MGNGHDVGYVAVGMVVVKQSFLVGAGGSTGSRQVVTRGEHGVLEIVDVFGAVAIAVEGVMAKGSWHELHGASGAGVGGTSCGTRLAGLDMMNGGEQLPGRASLSLDLQVERGVIRL